MFSTFFSSLSSLPLLSLPSHIQRHLFSFLLSKTVGKFVKKGLDGEGVEANLRGGRVKLRDVELDGEAITPLLSSLPFTFESGTVGSISASISSPLSLSATPALSIEVDDVLLVLRVSPAPAHPPPLPSPSKLETATSILFGPPSATPPSIPLTEAALAAAVASELAKTAPTFSSLNEDGQRRSPSRSPASSTKSFWSTGSPTTSRKSGMPGSFGGDEEVEEEPEVEVTVTLIERILARLQVKVTAVRVRLVWGEPGSAEEAVEVRVEEVRYRREEEAEVGEKPLGGVKVEWEKVDSVRTVTVTGLQVALRVDETKETLATPGGSTPTDGDSSSDSDDDFGIEPSGTMSQSIADLRASFVSPAPSISSPMSRDGSATGSGAKPGINKLQSLFDDPGDALSIDAVPVADDRFRTILSFGSDPLLFVASTPKATVPDPFASKPTPPSPIDIRLAVIDPLTVLLFPSQTIALLRLASLLVPSHTATTQLAPNLLPANPPTSRPPFALSVTLRTVAIVIVTSVSTPPPSSSDLVEFWTHSNLTPLAYSHLCLTLEELGPFVLRRPSERAESVITLKSFSLVEGGVDGTTLPVILSDLNLGQDYEEGNGEDSLPSFEKVDWITHRRGAGIDWRSEVPLSGAWSAGERLKSEKPTATFRRTLFGEASLSLVPIHIFIDLTLLDRISPLLTLSTAALPTRSSSSFGSDTHSLPSTPRITTPVFSSNEDNPWSDLGSPTRGSSRQTSGMSISCALVRVSVRCPSPKSATLGNEVRSGILVVDLWELAVEKGVEQTSLKWSRLVGAFARAGNSRAVGFMSLSAPPPPSASIVPPPPSSLPPQLLIFTKPTFSLDLAAPLLCLSLTKSTLDGLQLFFDDFMQLRARSQSNASGKKKSKRRRQPRRSETARSARAMGSSSSRGVEVVEVIVRRSVRVNISEVTLNLFVPTDNDEQLATRHVRGAVKGLDMDVTLPSEEKNELGFEVKTADLSLSHVSPSPAPIFAQTAYHNMSPAPDLLSLVFITSVDPDNGRKESSIQLDLVGFTYSFDARDVDLLGELARIAKAPAGAFENAVPADLTRVRLSISDGSILMTPPNLAGPQLVITLDDVKMSTNLIPDTERSFIDLRVHGLRGLAVESGGDLVEGATGNGAGAEYWKTQGFVQLLEVESSVVQVQRGNGLVPPNLEVLVSDTKLGLSLCADSMWSLISIILDLISTKSSRSTLEQPSKPDAALDYLAEALRKGSAPSKLSSRTRAGVAGLAEGFVISDIEGETIRVFDLKGLQVVDDYLGAPRTDDSSPLSPQSSMRCRLTNCDIVVHLHEGYDWSNTRTTVEEEAKRLRRRVEKVRQLLASKQPVDVNAEQLSVVVLGSIQLGLPPGVVELPPSQLAAVIDEALLADELDAATTLDALDLAVPASTSTAIPGRPPGSRKVSPSYKTTLFSNRNRLARSKAFAIEINLRGVGAQFDTFTQQQTAAKTRFDVDSFEIIDNIWTSTWKKFLTELRSSDGGVVRASGAPMVRIELSQVRPIASGSKRRRKAMAAALQDQSNETVLKVKVVPLRLYIDQDALDFVKTFFLFRKSTFGAPLPDPDAPPPRGTVFQRVEILPLKLKLDYKPKRVDYYALRQGRAAALMNFFHFDGSEMTLRHIIVNAVAGWGGLWTVAQDIWTLDIKANQLSDVISGLGPVRSVVNVGSGVANLVLLPIEQYRRDGNLMKGIQRGASSFARQTTLEALNVGARLATGTQVILEQAAALLGAGSTDAIVGTPGRLQLGGAVALTEEEQFNLISRYAAQPVDLQEGVESAYRSLGENFLLAAQTILAVPMEVYERSGTDGPIRAVVRAVPIAVLKPMIGASEALSKTLFGLRNTIDPELQLETADKYKQAQPSSSSHPQ